MVPLVAGKTRYKSKISALLRRHGCPCPPQDKFTRAGRKWPAGLQLAPIPGMMLRIYLVVSDAFSESSAERAERIQRLRQIAGIGEVFEPMIIPEVGDIERFWSKTRFVACCGLPCR